ncbi:MAG: hypothetical protein GJ676_01225 [Rhodobacteraceae bacterium]|nr:hypothetical protein [Paracoccaceae bacterium]
MSQKIYPILGDIWPYREAAAPPELASLPVDVFFTDPKGSSITAAQWSVDQDPANAPRASYALRLWQDKGQGELARWDPIRGVWMPVSRFPVPDQRRACSIIELRGILLSNVETPEALGVRLRNLLQSEMSEMKVYRLTAKVLAVMSIIILFYAVRSGVESNAVEPFALVFSLAVCVGMIAVGLRARVKTLSDVGLTRMREQFQFEYRASEHKPLTLKTMTTILQDHDRKREEEAVLFGFLLLLCFVYFISPLVVIGVIVSVIIVTLMTGDLMALRVLNAAFDRSESRLEQSFLSYRAGNDDMSPPALREAKKEVLKDRLRRYVAMLGTVREKQGKFRLSQDISMAVAFVIIFSSYAFPIAAGFQKLSISMSDSLVATSLFSVAPVIVLLSISKSSVALAQILNRRLMALTAK